MLNKNIEKKIERHILMASKLLKQLNYDDWAADLDATAYAINKDFEQEEKEYYQKYGFSHRELELM